MLIPLTGNTPGTDTTPGTAACTPVVVEDVAQPLPTGTTYVPAGANTTGLTPPVSPTDTGTAKVRSVRIINNYAGATTGPR